MKHALIPAARASEDYLDLMFTRKYLDPLPDKSTPAPRQKKVVHVHHAVPRSLAPEFRTENWNLVPLTLAEHVRAHELLAQATTGVAQIAMSRALVLMTQSYRSPDGAFDSEAAEQAVRITNAANSAAQSTRLVERWQDDEYRQRQSKLRSEINAKNWQDPQYRARQSQATQAGRQRRFEADPEFKKDVYSRQAEKMSGRNNHNLRLANIYRDEDASLVAANVCIREWCRENGFQPTHLSTTAKADRTRPFDSDTNRTHSQGLFARYLDDSGAPIGLVCPGLQKPRSPLGKPADLYAYSDDALIVENIIVNEFVKTPFRGVKLHQTGLQATAYADHSRPSGEHNRRNHKGYYIRYRNPE